MTTSNLDRYITEQAHLLGLTIDPAWRENVAFFLSVAEGMAKLVLETGAAETAEAAPVFAPAAREGE